MWGMKIDFNIEFYCIEYVGEEWEFVFILFFDNNCGDYVYYWLNDFFRDGRLKGVVFFNIKGEFVGMLVFEVLEIKRFLFLFLLIVDM